MCFYELFKAIQESLTGQSIFKMLLGSMFNIQCKLSEMLIDASNEWHFEIRKFSNFQSGCKHPEQTKTNKGEKLVQAKSLFKNYIAIQAFIRLFSGHGPQTGRCVLNDKPQRYGSAFVCQIQSWWVHYVSTIHSMIHPKVNRTFHLQVPSGRWSTCAGEDEAFDNWLRNPHSVHQGKDAWADWWTHWFFSEFNLVCPILGTT